MKHDGSVTNDSARRHAFRGQKSEVRSQTSARHHLISDLFPLTSVFCLLTSVLCLLTSDLGAIEDPPNCSLEHGGAGNISQGGLNFDKSVAHVGDLISVFPNLGMAAGACRAINATGVVYIASGPLTNFLENVTLDPGVLFVCPTNPLCRPGPYQFVITPALVGAPVNTPAGGAPGVPKIVRAAETGLGSVLTGDFPDQLADFHTASILIITPCLKVAATCDLAPGQNCFVPDAPVRFRGYVTN